MQISIPDPQFQTLIFLLIFISGIFLSIKRSVKTSFFDITTTDELKGIAILGIVFSHIGYFLSADTRFLYPLSVIAGVGVNLFLFLSGYGLTASALKTPLSVGEFYFKRLKKIFIPLWAIITVIFLLDYFLLQRSYPLGAIIENYLGFFPRADLWESLDSPLWYFSLIFFYYLVFPLVFWKKGPILAPILILLITQLVFQFNLPVDKDVFHLYQLHFLAFPLGVALAVFSFQKQLRLNKVLKTILIIPLIYIFGFTAIHSGVGGDQKVEQLTSLVTMFSLIGIFLLKNFRIRFLGMFGILSYEIYLLHWPILSRYDYLYKNLPAFLATALYLGIFLTLGWIMRQIIVKLSKYVSR